MYEAVLFDLDGTLTDTLADIAAAMNRALRLHDLPEWPVEAYRYLVGNGAKVLSERCVRERQELAPAVRQTYQAYYETHNLVITQPYEGVPEMLRALAAAGIALAVLSNKPDADTKNVVRHFFPEVPFRVVRGQMEGVPVKPDPAGAVAVAAEMGIAPGDFLYLGDTAVDMRCALAAGMHPVGALWGFRTAQELQESGAEALVQHPSELLRLMDV
ncbi:MAG: HAD family hydrolase [Clostridia bacterium]|nr:HAD family hydrolase [Clostridia bacterium]